MNLGVYAKSDNPNTHGMPHVDLTNITEPLLTAIYYVNESTGDTLIFDQKFGQSAPLTVKARVPPVKGRLVVFDGALLHAGNTPRTNAPRVNINFDAFVYEGAQTQ
jgi:ectoine hydroxylase-related dioxygenase (phytanoyl-CoA dioxygenase family)